MSDFRFDPGRKYVRASVKEGASYSAVAFLDLATGYWLEAESWKRPSRRHSAAAYDLQSAYEVSRRSGQG